MSQQLYPKVSIITVCYNSAKTLEKTVKSVIEQTYPNVEYIVIDGGSTDGTVGIIKRYQGDISYWVSESDAGIYDAMNKGIKISTGSFIAILNSDDWYDKNAIEISMKKIIESNADYSYANVRLCNSVGACLSVTKSIVDSVQLERKILQEMPFPHITMLISRSIYEKIGYYSTDYKVSSDHELVVRLYRANCYKGIYVDHYIGNISIGGVSNCNFNANREYRQIAIKYGQPKIYAYGIFYFQIFKYYLNRFLPKYFLSLLKKYIQSRHR